jgi:outer membrane receptor protein involved in Fe transport
MSGGSGLENQYVVDGVNITNAGYGALGSYSIVFGSLGNGVPFDFVKETQVKTGGYEAEFGQSTGGVVNVVTKSGSNTVAAAASATPPESSESRTTRSPRSMALSTSPTPGRTTSAIGAAGRSSEPRVLLRRHRSAVANGLHRAGGLPLREPET